LSNRKVPAYRRNLGVVFQDFRLLPTKTVFDNVAFALRVLGQSEAYIHDAVPEVLGLVGLGNKENRLPHELSGGEQQRVAIARALVHEPPLVICDEPTAALDARNGEIVLDLFRQVARSPDRAVIIVTHDSRIFSYADRIARMDDGEIVEVHEQTQPTPPHFVHEHSHG
jgi:ABC-type ATPase involved in cell division